MRTERVPAIYKSADGYSQLMRWYEDALGHLTVPYRTRMVSTRYGEIHMIAAGEDAPGKLPIVLLHGLGANGACWWPQINELARSYRVYAPDISGGTGKSLAEYAAHSGDGYSEWLLDLLDALKIERAHMVGLSLGGRMTIKLAAYPRGAAGVWPLSLSAFGRMFVYGVLKVLPPNEAGGKLLAFSLAPDTPLAGAQAEEMGNLLGIYVGYVKKHMEIVLPFGLPERMLRAVSAPTLLLMGVHDALYHTGKTIKRARKLMPDVRAEIVAGTGHALTWERPKFVSERILGFLESGD